MKETNVPENRAYKVTLILLLGLAAFSSAMKDLNRLHEMVNTVHEFTRQLRGSDLANEKPISTPETVSTNLSCPKDSPSVIDPSAGSALGDPIAAATDGYVNGLYYDIFTGPDLGAKVDLIAGKRANRKVPKLARPKFEPAKNQKEETCSIHLDGSWPARFEYKTLGRRVTLELPMTMVTRIKGDAFENEIPPDFLLGLQGKLERQQSPGKSEIRRRELMIKRLERSISSRRAS